MRSDLAERVGMPVFGVEAVINGLDVELPGKSPRSDQEIAVAAVFALGSALAVTADRIQVTVGEGWLKLEGEVTIVSRARTNTTQDAVRYLAGVTGVISLISLGSHSTTANRRLKVEQAFERNAELVFDSHDRK